MTDFALDPLTRDLLLPLRPRVGAEETAQRIGIRLRCWLAEWFLDTRHGVPYLQEVLGKRPRPEMVEATLRAQILDVQGVRSLQSFTLKIDPATRKARIEFVADTAEGQASGSFLVSADATPPPPPVVFTQPPVAVAPPAAQPTATLLLVDDGTALTDDLLEAIEV